MMKTKYILKNSLGMISGTSLMLPTLLTRVSADGNVDLGGAELGTDGTLKIPGAGGNSDGNTVSVFNTIMDKGRIIVAGITGVLAIVMVGLFTWKAFNLSKSSDNPSERSKCISSMIFYFIGAALFGGASLLSGLFYNLLV